MYLAGDVRLFGVVDCEKPFANIQKQLQSEDIVYGNLEGALYDEIDPYEYYSKLHWRHAGTSGAGALKYGNFSAVGLANNVIIGGEAIRSTINILDEMDIAHTGAGMDLADARAPAIVEKNGIKYGFLQRTSIFWPTHHRAVPNGPYRLPNKSYVHGYIKPGNEIKSFVGAPGVATIRPHTAYEPSFHSVYEAGGAAIIHTWPDPDELSELLEDIQQVRPLVDILVVSNHWRVLSGSFYEPGGEIGRDFRIEIAHAAIDAGADIVASHGTHYIEEIEVYKGKAIFYGMGELYFGHHPENAAPPPKKRADLLNLLVRAEIQNKAITKVSFQLLLSGGMPLSDTDGVSETVIKNPGEEKETVEYIQNISRKYGTEFNVKQNEIEVIME